MTGHAGMTKESTDMKGRIVQAAKAMSLETGYDKSSVNGLLERLGIAKGTL